MNEEPTSPKGASKFASAKKRTGTFVKKFASSFDQMDTIKKWSAPTAKQALAEKFGKAKKTESTNIHEKEKIIDEMDVLIPRLYRATRKEYESIQEYAASGVALGDQIESFSSKMTSVLNSNSDWELLCEFLQRIADFQRNYADIRKTLSSSIAEKAEKPLSDFVKVDIKHAKDAKSKWTQSRLAYDASVAKLEEEKKKKKSKSERIKELEAESNALKVSFDNVDRQTNQRQISTIDVCELELIKTSCDYLKSYHEFFLSGVNLVNEILSDMEEMRHHYEEKKDVVYGNRPLVRSSSVEILSKPALSPSLQTKSEAKQVQAEDKEDDDSVDDDELLNSLSEEEEDKDFNSTKNDEVNASLEMEANYPSRKSIEDTIPVVNNTTTDVGLTLQEIMEAENRKLEEKWEREEREKEMLARKEREIEERRKELDWSKEFKYGSNFYEYLAEQMKDSFVPELTTKVEEVRVPPVSEEVEGGMLGGQINFSLGELALAQFTIPQESVSASFLNDKTLLVVWNNVSAGLESFEWSYTKDSFPKLKDSGTATASISDVIITATIIRETVNDKATLLVQSTAVKVGSLDIKISGSIASSIYNLVLGAFSSTMKSKVQSELEKAVNDFFKNKFSQLPNNFLLTL